MVLLLCGHYALYKEDKYYSHDDYDENKPDSPADDLVAVRGNWKLLGQSEITKGILDFVEVGMKYRINAEIKENKYCHEIEAVREKQQKSGIRFSLARLASRAGLPKSYAGYTCTVILGEVKNLLLRKQYITVIIKLNA